MQDLIEQEKFELEVLEKLNSGRFLDKLLFGGGTMMRLCFGLERYSVDLDFWLKTKIDEKRYFKDLRNFLGRFYLIKDAADKRFSILFELKSDRFPRFLKIEIRKEIKKVKSERAIAFSRYSNVQVLLNAVALEDMMKSKIEAFLDRKEIRDVFDIEFMLKRGVQIDASQEELNRIIKTINNLNKRDYTQKLGSLIEAGQRSYYTCENFKILKSAIHEKISSTWNKNMCY